MGSYTPGAEAPFKYTVESFVGVRDAWLSFAADRLSKFAIVLEQYKDKLPEPFKSKLSKLPNIAKSEVPAPTTRAAAPLES
jgi:hypothetical protein